MTADSTYVCDMSALSAEQPFFDFALHVVAGANCFDLDITGPEGIEPFIEAEFAALLPDSLSFPPAARRN